METFSSLCDMWESLSFVLEANNFPIGNNLNFGNLAIERPGNAQVRIIERNELASEQSSFNEFETPTFYENIPSLQEMAAFVVAIALWRRVISRKNPTLDSDSLRKLNFFKEEDDLKVLELLHLLPVPRSIQDTIEHYLKYVKTEMNDWLGYYASNLIASKRIIHDLLFCVWLPNGKIDHKLSASNLLSNPKLTDIDKFKIMCRYCLEEEVKKLPAHSIPSHFAKKIPFNKNALMYYWLCRVNGDTDKFPKIRGESLESFLITAFNVDTWSAIEYFWDRLSPNEQLSKAKVLIIQKPHFQRQLFSKMNNSQKVHLLFKFPVEIAINFYKQKNQHQFTLVTWMYIKNFVTYEQFRALYRGLLLNDSDCEDDKARCLVDIWNHAPVELKNQALQHSMIQMLIRSTRSKNFENSCYIELLLAYLSYCGAKHRKRILYAQAADLVQIVPPSMIDELIKLCSFNPDDVVTFKKYVLNSAFARDVGLRMLYDRCPAELSTFLEYYGVDLDSKIQYCVRVVESYTSTLSAFYKLHEWVKIVEFIDNYLADRFPDRVLVYKSLMAEGLAKSCFTVLFCDDVDATKVLETVNTVLNAEMVRDFKTRALATVEILYRWHNFNENTIDGFILQFCDHDIEMVKEFKKSLPIVDIFDRTWGRLVQDRAFNRLAVNKETVFRVFEPLDKLLFWYFENVDDVKRFKLQKVFGYFDTGASMFQRFLSDDAKLFTRSVLPWFFDGDCEEIDKFKEHFQGKEIAKMI